MAADVNKNLERAKKLLEKNRFEDAIEAYLAVLQESPQNVEAAQMLGDLYTRLDHPDRAAVYYGHLFELLVDPRDESKAMAIYNRFLRNSLTPQPPERIARYAFLQQKQNRPEEAIDQYIKAAELFSQANRMEDALFCWERTAQLEPDNLNRQLKVAETASQLGKNALAARSFLRAGTLAAAGGSPQEALKLLGRAYALAPQERSVALLYAEAKLRNGEAAEAAALLEPFAANESDVAFRDFCGRFASGRSAGSCPWHSRGAFARKERGHHALVRAGRYFRGRGAGVQVRGNSTDPEAQNVCGQEANRFYDAGGRASGQAPGVFTDPGVLGRVVQRVEP